MTLVASPADVDREGLRGKLVYDVALEGIAARR
jgi:hypothetical protein